MSPRSECPCEEHWIQQPGCDPDVPRYSYYFLVNPDCPWHWEAYEERMAIIRHWNELDLK